MSRRLRSAQLGPNAARAVFEARGEILTVPAEKGDARYPVFDKDGKYLYFAASTDSGPSLQPDAGSFSRAVTSSLYLVVLPKDEPSPFAPESDEEKPAEKSKAKDARADVPAKPDAAKEPSAAKPVEVKVDTENIGQRIERDFFYDPGFHGLDLKAAEKLDEPFLPGIASRADLNYLFAEMLGNMVVGHLGVGGGEQPEVKRVQTGLLGCDFKIENGRCRFARDFNGENWNPGLTAPLTRPGVNVTAGQYLLAVDGRNLSGSDKVCGFFEGTAGKQTVIRVGPDPAGANARDVTVIPIASDFRLRNLAWIEENRRKVDQMTNGRVAYIYLPDTSLSGFTNFNRYFFAQTRKEAAIIDERFNAGGQLATDVIGFLSRKLLSSVATRDGEEEIQPQGVIAGPKVMLINENDGSGGDAMPWYFRCAGVGRLIGKRTWGGLAGGEGAPDLMDGGIVTAPSSAVCDLQESKWIAENTGIASDMEVEHDPQLVRQG